MREVTLVTSIKTNKVQLMNGRDAVKYHSPRDFGYVHGTDDVLLLGETISVRFAPVVKVCGTGRSDVYFAYTDEVERTLGIPIGLLVEETQNAREAYDLLKLSLNRTERERDNAQSQLDRFAVLSLWGRIKFLLTRIFP